ncbi:MAG: hypothetical protein HOO96_28265, partial [Polyangiaceae bacterium]|nr:hypothetical protein [Polyangiaceae bacterium]
MPEAVIVFHPAIDDDDVVAVMQPEDFILLPKPPFLRFVGRSDDAWGRRVLLYRGDGDLVANLVVCHLTGLRFVHVVGALANNVAVAIIAAQTASGQPRFPLDHIVAFAAHADNERDRVQSATVLSVAALDWSDDVARAVRALLADEETRIAVAERMTYRCPPEMVALLEEAAAADADPTRRAALT